MHNTDGISVLDPPRQEVVVKGEVNVFVNVSVCRRERSMCRFVFGGELDNKHTQNAIYIHTNHF